MFGLKLQMRVRIMTAPAFTGANVIAVNLFEGAVDREAEGGSLSFRGNSQRNPVLRRPIEPVELAPVFAEAG